MPQARAGRPPAVERSLDIQTSPASARRTSAGIENGDDLIPPLIGRTDEHGLDFSPPDRPSCCGTYLLMLRLPDRLLTIALRLPGPVYNVSISESLRSQTTGSPSDVPLKNPDV